MITAPVFAISRHRLSTDGEGVTTLVAFHGCPLSCRYCINNQCLEPDATTMSLTAEELIEELMIDNLYFVATGGGVTFGGGEPLLRYEFIRAFCELCPKDWKIYIETSLNVPLHYLQSIAPFVSKFYIDIKDMNADIYERYTGKSNQQVIDNLNWLATQSGMQDDVVIRLPRIPAYNTKDDIENSKRQLEAMNFRHFDCLRYITKKTILGYRTIKVK